ncbi:hypothetical protein H5410_049304 [Solanum commersonii]|uniref:Uncharacterized protein n=1 Tax=Solanum commersonii TaxID=4109 RepID=A0A9J5WTS9_SOLCO|nr:hypothetical protein H5410_049304 [Solanum commersonii]
MDLVVPHGQNGPFSRVNDPQSRVNGIFGVLEFRPHFVQNFTWISVKTLPMGPIGPHGQNDPFSRLNDPRNSLLALTANTFHFQGQMIPRTDLTYRASWPSRPKRLIFKVKSSKSRLTRHFADLRSMKFLVIQNSDLIFAKILPGRPLRPYQFSQFSLITKMAHFQGETIPGTLPIEPVGPHGQNDAFSRSNESWSSYGASWPSRPKGPIFKVKQSAEQTSVRTLPMEPVGPYRQRPIFQGMKFLVIRNSDLILPKILPRHPLRPYLWRQLIPRAGKPPFYQFSCAIVYGIFGDSEFRPHFCQNFTCTSIKTLPMEPVGPNDQNDQFSRLKDPRSRPYLWSQLAIMAKTTHFLGETILGISVNTLPMEPVGPHGQNDPFSMSKDPRSRRPLRSYLWSQLALTAKTANFQVQMIPEVVHEIFGDPELRPHFFKNIILTFIKTFSMVPICPHGQNDPFSRSNDPRSRLYLWSKLALTAKTTIFKVKQSPEKFMEFLVIPDLIFAKILPRRPLRPYLRNQFALRAIMAHFQSQTIPAVDLSYGASCPSRPKGPIFKDLTYGASWPSLPKLPIFKVKRSLEQNFNLIFTKILPGRPLRPYLWSQLALTAITTNFLGQTTPEKGHPLRPYLWCQLALRAKTTHFLGQTIPENSDLIFAKILPGRPLRHFVWIQLSLMAKTAHFQGETIPGVDLSYRANWPTQLKCPILKTLAMEPVGPHSENGTFLRLNVSRSSQKKCWTSVKTLAMEPVCSHGQNVPFSRYGASWPSRPKLPIFEVKRPPEQLALTAKTSHFQGQMNPGLVGPHSQNIPFSRSNDPRSRCLFRLRYGAICPSRPKRPIFKVKRPPEKFTILFGDPELRPHFCQTFSWMSVKTLGMELVGPHGQNVPFSRSTEPRSKPYLWSQFALTAKMSHFECQTNPREVKLPILQLFVCYYSPWTFWCPEFQAHFCDNFSWTSVKTLAMELVDPHDQKVPFSRLNEPQSRLTPHFADFRVLIVHGFFVHGLSGDLEFQPHFCQIFSWTSVKTLAIELVGPHGQKPVGPHDQNIPFSRSNEPQTVHGLFGDLEFEAHFCQKIPWTSVKTLDMDSSQLALTAKMSNFEGQMIPSTDLSYGANWTSRLKRLIFKAKRSSEQPMDFLVIYGASWRHCQNVPFTRYNKPQKFPHHFRLNLTWTSVKTLVMEPSTTFYGDPEFQCHFCQNLTWTSGKTLTMDLVGLHGKNGPFTRLNEHQSRISTSFLPKLTWTSIKTLAIESVGQLEQNSQYTMSNDPQSSPRHFMMTKNSNIIFAKNLDGPPLRPYL